MQKKLFITIFLFFIYLPSFAAHKHFLMDKSFTLIDYNYPLVTQNSQKDIEKLLAQRKNFSSTDSYIQFLGSYFLDRPYTEHGAQGEGDWCGPITRGCVHIRQDPVYRTDKFNCQTLTQVILAIIESHNLDEFNKNIVAIVYGATGNNDISFYNRNNFIVPDWNRDNEEQHFLANATDKGILSDYVKTTSANVDRQAWFAHLANKRNIKYAVRVLNARDGLTMHKQFSDKYPSKFYQFKPEKFSVDYIPKTELVLPIEKNKTLTYQPNTKMLAALPTPSVVEIVRDTKTWKYYRLPIKKAIGTESSISHMGLLYRQQFKYNEIIYQKITCMREQVCIIKPIRCTQKTGCNEAMFLHATIGYPGKHYFYKDTSGNYRCTRKKPYYGQQYSSCNRVMALPIQDYLMNYQGGKYIYMTTPSILGIHIEKISSPV